MQFSVLLLLVLRFQNGDERTRKWPNFNLMFIFHKQTSAASVQITIKLIVFLPDELTYWKILTKLLHTFCLHTLQQRSIFAIMWKVKGKQLKDKRMSES